MCGVCSAPVGRKNGWQLAEFAGHHTPDGLQRLLNGAAWDAEDVRDDLQSSVAEHLGDDSGLLVIDDTCFIKTAAGRRESLANAAPLPRESRPSAGLGP
ncbi:hypothetical protein GCM10023336_45520 [Streptomyces similanensis]|uniref:Transposase IS701-like DDE domain-containing protein n=1 Tax=Streptomyces similanensis TaxID=1274988 RepID=A0ABP9KW09_9ACTN